MKRLVVLLLVLFLFGCKTSNQPTPQLEIDPPQHETVIKETIQNDVYETVLVNPTLAVSSENIFFLNAIMDYIDLYKFDLKTTERLDLSEDKFYQVAGGVDCLVVDEKLVLVTNGIPSSGQDIEQNAAITIADLDGGNRKTISFDENQIVYNKIMAYGEGKLYFVRDDYFNEINIPKQSVLCSLDVETKQINEIAVLQSLDEIPDISDFLPSVNVTIRGTYYDGLILLTTTTYETGQREKISLYSLSENKIIETKLNLEALTDGYSYAIDQNGIIYYYDFLNNTLNSYDVTTEQTEALDIDMTQNQNGMSVEMQWIYEDKLHYLLFNETESQLFAVDLITNEITELSLTYQANSGMARVRIVQETKDSFIVVSGYQEKYVKLTATSGEYLIFNNKPIYTYSLISKEDYYNNQPNYQSFDLDVF